MLHSTFWETVLDIHRRPLQAIVPLIVVLLSACHPASGQDRPLTPDSELESRVADLFSRTCARSGCHAGPVPQMNLHLGSGQFPSSVVSVPSMERPDLKRVAPGLPDSSYLMMKLEGHPEIVGERMPLAEDPLDEGQMELISRWIAELDESATSKAPTQPTERFPFHGWKAINLPTSRTLQAGSFLFLISHRFNPIINDGYDAFYGLDGSGIIFLSFGYAFTDRLLVALARSNSADNLEMQARYKIGSKTGPPSLPVDVAAHAAVNWVTESPPDGASRLRGEAFKFTAQISLARYIGREIGVEIVPGITLNSAEDVTGEDPLLTLGIAGRYQFWRNVALVGEWVPIVDGYTRTTTFGNDIRFDTWGGGVEITTGGHVFQIVLTNSVGLTTDQYLRGGDLDIRDGEARLGFNIFRILNF